METGEKNMSEITRNRLPGIQKAATHKRCLIFFALALLFLAMMVAIAMGNLMIPLADVFAVFGAKTGLCQTADSFYTSVVWNIRFPRVCLAALAGALLSAAGTVFQGVFRNPLVEPYVLGISSGAAFGAAVAIVFLGGVASVSLFSFAFALLAMLLSYGIATKNGKTPLVNLILSGTVVASVFSSALNLVKTFASDSKLREISFWLMGGFYTAKWNDVLFLAVCATGVIGILWALGWKLNVLSMGDQEASSMGVRVWLLKAVLILAATFGTASTVSTVGIVSWVGLMVPHASRMMIGPDHRYLIPFSACLGGFFLVVCDTIARTIIMGEIPVSIITSILGAPYLVFLLRKNRQVGMS